MLFRSALSRSKGVFGALLAASMLACCLMGGCTQPSPSNLQTEPEILPVTDHELRAVTFTVTVAGDCTLGTDEHFGYGGTLPAKWDEVNDPSYFLSNVQATSRTMT